MEALYLEGAHPVSAFFASIAYTCDMKLVLTGEDELSLQKRLTIIVQELQQKGETKQDVDLRKVTPEQLAERLGAQSLFGTSNTWLIQGWQSLRSPKQADSILEQLTDHLDAVVIVVPDKLTPAKKKKLASPWKIESFDPPSSVFTFLENIKLKPLPQIWPLYLQALESSGEWGVHALASRQVWMLLQYKSGEPSVAANPWMAKKLDLQAARFSMEELLAFTNSLFEIEFGIKSGKNKLPWREQFDVCLTKLYAHPVTGKSSK